MSPLCSVTSGTPTCQKSKSDGLYHFVMSRIFSACSVADIIQHICIVYYLVI